MTDVSAGDRGGFTFQQAIKSGLNKYATFSGRSSRSEYWYFILFCFLASVVASILDATFIHAAISPLQLLTSLVLLVPNISISVRRLHDLDRSGWWYWIVLIPLIGAVILIVWFCMRGTPGSNQFG